MRCQACDRLLTDLESTRKDEKTSKYIDLCSSCFYFVTTAYDDDIEVGEAEHPVSRPHEEGDELG